MQLMRLALYRTPAFFLPSLPFHYDLSREVAGCFRRWERLFEGKSIRCLSMSTQVVKALLCLFYPGDVTTGNPPEGRIRTIEPLEPLAALLQYRTVAALVDKGGEIGETCPH